MSLQVCPGVSSRASLCCRCLQQSPSARNRQSYVDTASGVSEVQLPKPACRRPRAFSSSVSPPLWSFFVCRDTQSQTTASTALTVICEKCIVLGLLCNIVTFVIIDRCYVDSRHFACKHWNDCFQVVCDAYSSKENWQQLMCCLFFYCSRDFIM